MDDVIIYEITLSRWILSCFDISLLSVRQDSKDAIPKNVESKILEKFIGKLIEILILFYNNEVTAYKWTNDKNEIDSSKPWFIQVDLIVSP